MKGVEHLDDCMEQISQNIEYYLNQDKDYHSVTRQSIISINQLFRGWIVRNWHDINEPQPKKMHILSKLIIKWSAKLCSEAWRHRCDIQHNPNKYEEFMHNQHKNAKEKLE